MRFKKTAEPPRRQARQARQARQENLVFEYGACLMGCAGHGVERTNFSDARLTMLPFLARLASWRFNCPYQ